MRILADDCILYKNITFNTDRGALQNDLDTIMSGAQNGKWSVTWIKPREWRFQGSIQSWYPHTQLIILV